MADKDKDEKETKQQSIVIEDSSKSAPIDEVLISGHTPSGPNKR